MLGDGTAPMEMVFVFIYHEATTPTLFSTISDTAELKITEKIYTTMPYIRHDKKRLQVKN